MHYKKPNILPLKGRRKYIFPPDYRKYQVVLAILMWCWKVEKGRATPFKNGTQRTLLKIYLFKGS